MDIRSLVIASLQGVLTGIVPWNPLADLHVVPVLAIPEAGQVYITELELQRVTQRSDDPPGAGHVVWIEEGVVWRADDAAGSSHDATADFYE